jgi:hypothetical protein
MLTTKRATKQMLKADILRQIDLLHKDELIDLRRYLARILAHRLIATATRQAEKGILTGDAIQEAILQHRQQHPYE